MVILFGRYGAVMSISGNPPPTEGGGAKFFKDTSRQYLVFRGIAFGWLRIQWVSQFLRESNQ
jgi:hypothetical protein